LLDSELLAEVWLAMTRGQDALIMDFEEGDAGPNRNGSGTPAFDASRLRVLVATADELRSHEEYLDGLDKAAGQPCLWRAQA
jgi:DNA polymerase-3 subunit epsilon